MSMVGAGRAKELEPGVGVPQVADRVPNVGTHAGRRLGGRPLAPCDWVPEQGQQGQVWAVVASQLPHHGDDVVVVILCGVGHPSCLTSVSRRGLPIGARVGVCIGRGRCTSSDTLQGWGRRPRHRFAWQGPSVFVGASSNTRLKVAGMWLGVGGSAHPFTLVQQQR